MKKDPSYTDQEALNEVLKKYPRVIVDEGEHSFGYRISRDPYTSEQRVVNITEHQSKHTGNVIPLISYKEPSENRWEHIEVTPEGLIFKVVTMDDRYEYHEEIVELDDNFRDLLELSKGGLEIMEAFYNVLMDTSETLKPRLIYENDLRVRLARKPVADIETSLSFIQNTLNGINTFLEEERE